MSEELTPQEVDVKRPLTANEKFHVRVARSFVDWVEAGRPTEYHSFSSYGEALTFFEKEAAQFPKDKQGGVMMFTKTPDGRVEAVHVRSREWNTEKKWAFTGDNNKVSL